MLQVRSRADPFNFPLNMTVITVIYRATARTAASACAPAALLA